MNKRVLIIKLSAIGDVVMALPMIEAAKKKYGEDVEITWVCGKTASQIIKTFFNVKLIEVDEKRLLKGNIFSKIFEVIKLWLRIVLRRYKLVATAHSDIRYRLLTLPVISKIKRHWGITDGRKHPVPGRYHGYEAVWLITGDDDYNLTEYKLPKYNSGLSRHLKMARNNGSKNIVLVPGGAKNVLADNPCRRWQLEKYVELAKRLIEENNHVILVGSSSDEWVIDAFSDVMASTSNYRKSLFLKPSLRASERGVAIQKIVPINCCDNKLTNLIGKTNLIELLDILNQADVIVTHDTGTLHLAQLTNARIIALFGPTNPYEKIQISDKIKIFWKPENLPCCPCYDGKTYADCRKNRCMEAISVEEVIKEVVGGR